MFIHLLISEVSEYVLGADVDSSNGFLDPEREIYCLELLKTIFD